MKKLLLGITMIFTFQVHSASVMDLVDMTLEEVQCSLDTNCMPAQQRSLKEKEVESDCSIFINSYVYHSDYNPLKNTLINDLNLNRKYDVVEDSESARFEMTISIQGNPDDLSKTKTSIVVRDKNSEIYEIATGKSGYFKRSALSSLEASNDDLNGCK